MPPPRKKTQGDFSHLRLLAQKESAPVAVRTALDIKRLLIPSSFKQYEYTIQLWADFSLNVLEKEIGEPPFVDPPSVYQIKLFIRFLAASRAGLLDDSITTTTAQNRLGCLKRAVKLHTNYVYGRAQNADLEHFLEKELVHEGVLSTSAHAKPIAPLPVVEDLLHFLWACDEYQMSHPRVRLQLAFSMVLMSLLGNRPGEFIESDAWKHTNEGLLYDDITLVRQESPVYNGYLLHVKLRNRKGHRENKKHAPVMLLYEERSSRQTCPVTYFLALALADGVLEKCNTIHDIHAKRYAPGSSIYRYSYKPEAKERPILRSVGSDGAVCSDRILTYNCLNGALKGLGQRAGYEENLSAYCFRRAFAKAIDKTATSTQRQKLMGHTNDNTMSYYISGLVGIDSQSMVRGRAQRVELLDENCSMMARRNLLAPQPPGSQLVDQAFKPIESKTVSLVVLSPRQEYDMRRQRRNKMYVKTQKRFWENDGEELEEELKQDQALKLGAATSEVVEVKASLPQRLPSRYLKALWKHEPERRRLVELLYCNGVTDQGAELALDPILESLVNMANPPKKRYAYNSAQPGPDGSCGVCKQALPPKGRPARNHAHLLDCAKRQLIKEERRHMDAQFRLVGTCRWHDCGYRFSGKPCGTYSNHVTEHVIRMQSNQCLWNSCFATFSSDTDLAYHISQKHGVPNEWTMLTKMAYCYEHDLWYKSEQQWEQHIRVIHHPSLGDYCGMIRLAGLVVVAAHCLFCLGDTDKTLSEQFAQFPDVNKLHTHMEEHVRQLAGSLSSCPHPKCAETIGSDAEFWEHANAVHGMPFFGPRRTTGKRKTLGDGDEDTTRTE